MPTINFGHGKDACHLRQVVKNICKKVEKISIGSLNSGKPMPEEIIVSLMDDLRKTLRDHRKLCRRQVARRVAAIRKEKANRLKLRLKIELGRQMWERGDSLRQIAAALHVRFRDKTELYQYLRAAGIEAVTRKRVWTPEEEKTLRELVSQGTSLAESASALKRSPKEIEEKSAKLRLHEFSDLRFVSGMTKSLSRPHSHAPKRSQ